MAHQAATRPIEGDKERALRWVGRTAHRGDVAESRRDNVIRYAAWAGASAPEIAEAAGLEAAAASEILSRDVVPVGLTEIADRLGVARATVDQWRLRDVLPEPRWIVGGRPAWEWAEIERWARQTGRL